MCHGNLKKYYPRVLLDKLYTLMDMYIKSLKKNGGLGNNGNSPHESVNYHYHGENRVITR